MQAEKVKAKFKHAALKGLSDFIQDVVKGECYNDDDKLLFAVLEVVKYDFDTRLRTKRKDYNFQLPAYQAIALGILFQVFVKDQTTYVGITLLQFSNNILKPIN